MVFKLEDRGLGYCRDGPIIGEAGWQKTGGKMPLFLDRLICLEGVGEAEQALAKARDGNGVGEREAVAGAAATG